MKKDCSQERFLFYLQTLSPQVISDLYTQGSETCFSKVLTTFTARKGIYETARAGCRYGAVVRALASHQCGPGFDSSTWFHMWVEFVGSLLCTKRFSPGTRFPLSSKTNIWLDLHWLSISLYSVPNQCSSAKSTRHLNKDPFLFFPSACLISWSFKMFQDNKKQNDFEGR